MQKVAAVLRSFLKFLATEGKIPAGLEQHIESPRHYRGERLPRALPWDDVLVLLRSVDRSTSKGRRDYAMLLLIATYGLRVGEVARLELDDIAWRDEHICIPRPKVGTPLLFPLTDEIASALLEYLRHDRPHSIHRRVFLRVREPVGPIESTAICDAFDAWVARAGIRLPHLGGTHCLRHAVAMHLLRQQPRSRPSAISSDIAAWRVPAFICASMSKTCATLPCRCQVRSSRRCNHDRPGCVCLGTGTPHQALP